MRKGAISILLRNLGLMHLTDKTRYYYQKIKNRKDNKEFMSEYPGLNLPTDYLLYESFQLNYRRYYIDSQSTANWIKDNLAKHIALKNLNILDWGCGPGRVIQHMPKVVNNGCKFYGTDYNKKSIDWCKSNLKGIEFNCNTLEAKLPYADNFFDVIYGISIFTHLSEKMHYEWLNELVRITKPGGVLYLTTQGENFQVKLSKSELEKFKTGNIVVRGKVKEGHRTYSAFHPIAFIKSFFSDLMALEHIVTKPESNRWLPQDVWIVQKKS